MWFSCWPVGPCSGGAEATSRMPSAAGSPAVRRNVSDGLGEHLENGLNMLKTDSPRKLT